VYCNRKKTKIFKEMKVLNSLYLFITVIYYIIQLDTRKFIAAHCKIDIIRESSNQTFGHHVRINY
jgi:hypothetical protein